MYWYNKCHCKTFKFGDYLVITAVNMQQKSEIIYFCRSLCEVQNISYCPAYAIVRTKRILRVLFYRSKTAKTHSLPAK